jgi:hypothetical protein
MGLISDYPNEGDTQSGWFPSKLTVTDLSS